MGEHPNLARTYDEARKMSFVCKPDSSRSIAFWEFPDATKPIGRFQGLEWARAVRQNKRNPASTSEMGSQLPASRNPCVHI